MTAWLSVLVPLLIMFFALGMERVERRLRETTVHQEELEDFLEHARPDEVGALFRQGTSRALELFRLRNRRQQNEATDAALRSAATDNGNGSAAARPVRPTRVAS